jgi:tetratricopeptide (TPR) repeat protein/predicted Ser/Thr protein kinase
MAATVDQPLPNLLTCICGHQWKVAGGAGAAPSDIRCPHCGARATPTRPTEVCPLSAAPDVTQELPDGVPRQFQLPNIPGYDVLMELGRGGMGVVYQARQKNLDRVVALKMVLDGAQLSPRARARFEAEALAVARLQHPNIVQLYEVGEHEGRPYFSLEYVDGGSLAQQLRGQPQPVAFAAEMTETLARAVDYAHRHGIIHRDLKPANVLLTAGGLPRVTDFGLAKRLDVDAAGHTKSGDVMGTPSYMAPEQAHGRLQDIGPATDVYALGTLLYEMLTGRPPFRGETTVDTLIQVRFDEPVSPARLRAKLPRDLETICLKCLQKEPARRYAAAGALADDLRRFRAGEPIQARPTGAGERLLKWARRRPALAALAGVSAAATAAVLAVSLASNIKLNEANAQLAQARDQERREADEARYQKGQAEERRGEAEAQRRRAEAREREADRQRQLAVDREREAERQRQRAEEQRRIAEEQKALAQRERQRAEANFSKARKAVDLMLTQVGQEHLTHVPGMAGARAKLLEEALRFYEGIPLGEASTPSLRQETGRAYDRVGDITKLLGNYPRAQEAYQKAIAIFAALGQDDPHNPDYRQDLALAHFHLGRLFRDRGQLPEARVQYEQARRLLQELHGDKPGQPDYRQQLAQVWNALGLVLRNDGQPQEARQAYHRALALQQELVKADSSQPDYVLDLAGTYNDRGNLLRATGALRDAETDYRAALTYLHKLQEQNPEHTEYRLRLAAAHSNLGYALRTLAMTQKQANDCRKYLREAKASFQAALGLREKLAVAFPTVPQYQLALADSLSNLATVQLSNQDLAEAEKGWRRAEAVLRNLVHEWPRMPDYQSRLGGVLDNLAVAVRSQTRGEEALKLLQEALRHHGAALKVNMKSPEYRQLLHIHYQIFTETLLRQGQADQARQAAEELAARFPGDGAAAYQAAVVLARLASLSGKEKDQADAFAAKAVYFIDQALRQGYQPPRQLSEDPALAPLRDRPDFQRLAARPKR